MQFAFAKVKDPNSGLPKSVLIAWCGGGVPERTKGYFTSHLAAVSKILHGYHVQITARSDADLEPESIMRKVADASGSKYSGGGSGGEALPMGPPPIKSKPVFTPTTSSAARNPLVASRSARGGNVDEDGWGADAPQVSRTQVEKVESAYRPTKVNMAELTQQRPEPSRFAASEQRDDAPSDVVRGAYQPVGKVDIAAIRAQAKKNGDDRPTTVKGAYEPVGKVDIAAIRAKAQKPAEESTEPAPRPLADRTAAFTQDSQSERLTTMPKPKVGAKFGGGSNFSGTKAPMPGGLGFGSPAPSAPVPAASTSRTFADEGGKTPAQIWAEKKARQGGAAPAATSTTSTTSTTAEPVPAQKSGSGWKSGYSGKSWAPVQASSYGRPAAGDLDEHEDDDGDHGAEAEPASPSGVSALRDRFKNAPPMTSTAPPPGSREVEDDDEEEAPPPPVPAASRPSGGFALPGLPSRPIPADEEPEPEDPSAYEPEPEEREESPVRIAIPVSRGADPYMEKPEEEPAAPPVPPSQIEVPREEDLLDEDETAGMARGASDAVARQTFEPEHVAGAGGEHGGEHGGKRAVIQYDYDKTEDNEIDLVEGEMVTDIDMVDDDWWMGTNSKGESGLFPSNYVELAAGDEDEETAPPPQPARPVAEREPEPAPVPVPAPAPASGAGDEGATATALYDYEAAEDNGMCSAVTSTRGIGRGEDGS